MLKLLLLSFFINFPCYAQDTSDWILAKEKNGVTVYTRTLSHSDYKEFKGKVNITANLAELLSFIKEPKNCPNWQYKCIYQLQLTEGYIYKLSNLPWPLNDRYTVMQSDESFNAQTQIHTLTLKNIPRNLLPENIKNQLPEEGNTLQMRTSDGYWKFDLSHAPNIHITHQMHGDPAGVIPASLANLGVINAAFVSLDNLRYHFALEHQRSPGENMRIH